MKDFYSLANEDWRIQIDENELNEPTICYPNPDRSGSFVGPLAMVHVGATVEDEDGEEVLDLEGADGRNLAAVACLPQVARLFRWINDQKKLLNKQAVNPVREMDRFCSELFERVEWIESCIDDRPETMNAGQHGFASFQSNGRAVE